ncbi:ABC transporter permease [Marinilabiliaceae bacterium JC040]|nr:ABC transporter permease [Marinilabiliaceae bacterium JC040]
MNLLNIGIKNIKGNLSSYITFFLATSFSVMIFFIFAMLIYHPQVINGVMKSSFRQGAIGVEIVIFTFLAFFVSYTLITYARKRSRDYAILQILGISSKQFMFLYLFENFVIFFSSIITGILLGLLFSKLFFIIIAYIIKDTVLDMYFPYKPIIITSLSFISVFIIVALISGLSMRFIKIINILKSNRKSQKTPKYNIIKIILGVLLIAVGYYLAYTATPKNLVQIFFPVLIMVIIGTYFFYDQSFIFFINTLKRNKKLYYKGINSLWISDLAHRLKDCTWVLFFSTIVIAIGLTAFSSIYSINYNARENLENNQEYSIVITSLDKFSKESVIDLKYLLDKKNVKYEYTNINAIVSKEFPNSVYIEKNKYLKSEINDKDDSIRNCNEKYILINNIKEPNITNSYKRIYTKLGKTYRNTPIYIVDKKEYTRLMRNMNRVQYHIFSYEDITLGAKDLTDINDQYYSKYKKHYLFHSKGVQYYRYTSQFNYILFLSFFVGIIFLICSGSMLYFKFFNHIEYDIDKFQNIVKIGLSKNEIRNTIRIQMAILFFLPIGFALSHSLFAMKALGNTAQFNIFTPVFIVIIGYLILQILYYFVINNRYTLHLISKIKF